MNADPTHQILAAWIAKEELRKLLAAAKDHAERPEIARRLIAFYTWCADADVPEITTLAETIDTWWDGIEAFLRTGITNASSEGYNRLVKDVTRRGCGFRNPREPPPPHTLRLHPAITPNARTGRPRAPKELKSQHGSVIIVAR